MKVLKRVASTLIVLYQEYPARANSYIAAGLVALAGVLHVGLNISTVSGDVAILVPLIIGELTHHRVSPA